MSSKKDKFTLKDKNFMKLALNLASARKGLTGENPSVGCLIVKNDQIISIGQTGLNGRPHAEHNALCSACGLPFKPVCPIEIIWSFFTIKQPTEGFSPVKPFRALARFKASFIKFLSLSVNLSFFEDIYFVHKLYKIFFFSKVSIN